MNCTELATAQVCYTAPDGTQQTLIAHYEYGKNENNVTILASTIYTDAEGVPVDTSAGSIKAGAAPVPVPDVEWEDRCDTLADGTTVDFICRVITTFNADGTVASTQTDNFELDKETEYAPQGTVKRAGTCPPAVAQGVLTTWGA